MPVIKDGNGVIQYTEYKHKDRFEPTGVIPDSAFAVCDEQDVTKQLKMNASGLATNTTRTMDAPTQDGTILAYTPNGSLSSGHIIRYQDSAWGVGWKTEPARESILFDDFFSSLVPNGETNWSRTVSGTGASSSALTGSAGGTAAHGVQRLTTGTTAAGRTALHRGISNINLTPGSTEYGYVEIMLRVTTLDDGVDTFNVRAGLGDSTAATTWADGIYYYYDLSVSPNWICRTTVSSVTTETITSVAVGTGYVRLAAIMNDYGLFFYINGTQVAWHTTNIPLNTNIGLALQITKTAGTNARTLDIDYVLMRAYYTNVRTSL